VNVSRRPPWGTLLVAIAVALTIGGVGAFLTDLGPWYYALKKPRWQPPDWLFGPVWTVIFCLLAASAAFTWANLRGVRRKSWMIVLFGLNALLNVAWSGFFFRMQRPDWALVEVGFFWLSIVALMAFTWPVSTKASLFLFPYLLWVAFASAINLAVVKLNAPF
jgi:tryptophan-rich sensory protein